MTHDPNPLIRNTDWDELKRVNVTAGLSNAHFMEINAFYGHEIAVTRLDGSSHTTD